MSRIGKQPVSLIKGVTAAVNQQTITITGPKGELKYTAHPAITVAVQDGKVVCTVARESKESGALWGTTRAQIANMVEGVTAGFRKQLQLQGVGFRAALRGANLELQVGFSHPVVVTAPTGISFQVEKELITVEGADKKDVGQVAANIRAVRPPEPYKGKGIRYLGEQVRRKVGKVAGTTTA